MATRWLTSPMAVTVLVGWLPVQVAWAQGDRRTTDPLGIEGWASRRVAVRWEGIPASEALADLANRLGQPIWRTETGRQRASQTRVHLVARHLTGFQAICVLCRLAGLRWTVIEGVVAVTDAESAPAAWRLSSLAIRLRALRDPPTGVRVRVGKETADLDLVDATIAAATARLSEAYGLNLWLPDKVRTSQVLISLQGKAVPVADAIAAMARQLRVRPTQADGVVWLLPDQLGQRLFDSQPVRDSARRVGDGSFESGWVRLREGDLAAEGWARDVRAVRQRRWLKEGKGASGAGAGHKSVKTGAARAAIPR